MWATYKLKISIDYARISLKKGGGGEINFNNIFNLTHYIQNIISTWNQYNKLLMNYFTLFLLTPSLQNAVCTLHMLSSPVWPVAWVLDKPDFIHYFLPEHVLVPEGPKVMMCLQTMSSSCFHQIESKLKQEENQDPGI